MVARNAGILLNRSPGPERAAIRSCPSPIPHRFRQNCCRWGREVYERLCMAVARRIPTSSTRTFSRSSRAEPGSRRRHRRGTQLPCGGSDPAAWPRAAIRPGQGERLRRTLGAAPGTTPDIACKHTDLTVSEIPPDGGKQGAVCAECVALGRAGSAPGSAGSAVMSDGRQLAQPPCARPPGATGRPIVASVEPRGHWPCRFEDDECL